MAETVGERLFRLRTERGLSQRDLSEPGVSYAYISRIEAGRRNASVKVLRKLAPKLGVSPEFLETGEEPFQLTDEEIAALSELVGFEVESANKSGEYASGYVTALEAVKAKLQQERKRRRRRGR